MQKIPYIACRDIGKVAALAFENPGRFQGQKLNLVGDYISGDELGATVSQLSGNKKYKYKSFPLILMYLFARVWVPFRKRLEKWGRPPYLKSIQLMVNQTKELLPDTLTFEQYLKWKGWDKKL